MGNQDIKIKKKNDLQVENEKQKNLCWTLLFFTKSAYAIKFPQKFFFN